MSSEFDEIGKALLAQLPPLGPPVRVVGTEADAAAAHRLGLQAVPLNDTERLRLLLAPNRPVTLIGHEAHAHAESFHRCGVPVVVGCHIPIGASSLCEWIDSELHRVSPELARTNFLTHEAGGFPIEPGRNKPTELLARLRRSQRERVIRLHTLAELANTPSRPALVRGMFGQGDFACLAGAPGAGKTFLSIALAVAIATGTPFLGRKVLPGTVVYIGGEGSSGIRTRWAAALGHRLDDEQDPCQSRLLVAGEVPDLTQPETRDPFVAALLALKEPAQLVVFDTWSRLLAACGADENSSTEVAAVVREVDSIRELTGASTLVVHHMRKDGVSERGSSVLRGAVDGLWLLQQESDLCARFSCDKARDLAPFQDHLVRFEPVPLGVDEDGAPLGSLRAFDGGEAGPRSLKPVRKGTLDSVRAALRAAGHNGLTLEELAAAAGVGKTTVHRHTRSLAGSGEAFVVPNCEGPQRWRSFP